MFELNGTYIIFIVLFLVFMFLFNKTVLRPVGIAMEKRKGRVLNDYQLARANAQEGDAVVARYQNHIHEIRSQAQKIVQDSMTQAQKKRQDKLTQVQSEGNVKVEQVRQELNRQKESLLTSLVEPELELVKEIKHKLLADASVISINRETVQRALEEAK